MNEYQALDIAINYLNEGFFGSSSHSGLSTEEKKEKTIQIIRNVFNSNFKGKSDQLFDQVHIHPHESPYVSILYVSVVDLADATGGLIDSKTSGLIKQFVEELKSAFAEDEEIKSKVANFDTFTLQIMVSY